jgi:hypothetical protein
MNSPTVAHGLALTTAHEKRPAIFSRVAAILPQHLADRQTKSTFAPRKHFCG